MSFFMIHFLVQSSTISRYIGLNYNLLCGCIAPFDILVGYETGVIIRLMERNKSTKEAQGQLLKEVLAEFDIETHVNRIALRCFNDLLKSNKQAFDVLAQSEKKIVEFQTRLCRTQSFAESIENNVSNKIEIANNLNRRLETFSTEFYANIKENEALIQTMRKDYDSLITSTQKNTYELRSIGDTLRKNVQVIDGLEAKVVGDINAFTHKMNENEVRTEKQFVQIRAECERMQESLTEARTHFLSKSAEFTEISKDIQLYKYEKDSINRRIVEVMKETETKLNKSDFNEMRLQFDSRLITDQQNNLRSFVDVRAMLNEEKEQRRNDVKNIISQSVTKWKEQDKANTFINTRLAEVREELAAKIEKVGSKQQFFEIAMRKEIDIMAKKQEKDITLVKQELKKHAKEIQQNANKICDAQKSMQQRYDQIIELSSTINSVSERLDSTIKEIQERKKEISRMEMNRMEATKKESKRGQELSELNDILTHLQEQIYEKGKNITTITTEITTLKTKHEELKSEMLEQGRNLMHALNNDKSQIQLRFTETNRHINDVSIQIMNNLHTVQLQSKKYVDSHIESIRSKLEFLDQVNQQIQDLKRAFQEQMKETQAINQSITEKMEKANAGMTKFKSDLSLRVDAIVNEQQRRSIQIKEIGKQVEDIRKHLGYVTEGVCVSLAVISYREFLEDNEGIKDIKISSLLEGWVLEIDEKQAKYRGEHLNRRKLVVAYLNFLIFNSDKVKGTLIESGKDIYIRMLEESQQIFTTRKKGLSKRLGSQLPKLHL